ncbi:glutathione-dependent disulfide-bond oxidoreductase [Novosphingobium sp.]|uniref:glutathione-dependent disulfide-bond oxidoreductase n=1 Tax=Novosphingobium sp. TaxID=1874826 RepID=UPI002736B456|nr:glutathione-dependent disulfide-bond oxidoreductase [Novosphingobium sp.]MDP3907051.1 glutathione-dependent disulfide-bond oxidoreductase [Novosphingobium sp.]
MSDAEYTPPPVWVWDKANGGQFASINRPTAGAQVERALPVGKHPFQLYSLGTPNGQKVTILLEELLAAGHAGAEYDAWLINIGDGDQFGSGFVALNPNSKIPAMLDQSGPEPLRLFESGAMLLHLADKFQAFIPQDLKGRTETICWLMWQMGSAPFMGGGYGHFYHYAPVKIQYAIDRYAMETKRLFDVANNQLKETRFLAGDEYTIADIAAYTWIGNLYRGDAYGNTREFLQLQEYEAVGRWVGEIDARPAVKRGRLVNRPFGEEGTVLRERHDASDFDALKPGVL